MAKLISVKRDKHLLLFEIEGGKYGRNASYSFKDGEMIVDMKKVGSLQRYFSTINDNKYYYTISSISKVLDKCDDEGTRNFFEYVWKKNENCTSFNTLLNRFKYYSKQEQWLSIIPNKFIKKYGSRYKFPEFCPSQYPKPLRKQMSVDEDLYNTICKIGTNDKFILLEKLIKLNNLHKFSEELFTNYNLEYEYGYERMIIFNNINKLVNKYNCDPEALMMKLQYYERYEGLNWKNSTDELIDYINMSILMEKKNFTKYPRMLRSCHDIITNVYNLNIKEYEEQKFKTVAKPELEWEGKPIKYNTEDGNEEIKTYTVIIPKTSKEVQQEGVNQSHCVASYIPSIINGNTYICFLRIKEKLDEPVLTLEVREGKLITALGNHNRNATQEEKDVLKKWCEAVKIGSRY